jgi:hypothetical protein
VFDRAGSSWQIVGTTSVTLPVNALVGLAVTSHDTSAVNTATIDGVLLTRNLLDESGFEGYAVPSLGPPGWVSDNPLRTAIARSETNQPHGGAQNGACETDGTRDCGIYQDITAPVTGQYVFSVFANSDRTGSLVGVNVNGQKTGPAPVAVRGFDNYGDEYVLGFHCVAGDTIRVWLYSPATPGYAVIDDATLVQYFGPT